MEQFGAGSNTPSFNVGDGPDIELLFKNYYQRLCYFAVQIINDKAAAEDIAQEAFVKYWNKKSDFNNESAAKTFLYVTVRNACLNVIRHEGVERKYLNLQDKDKVEEEWGLEQIIRAELFGEINKAIEELPEGCRTVLKLAYFEGLKNDEVAKQLGVSINTVKTQKARALQILRLKLDIGAFLLLQIILFEIAS